MPVIEHQVFIKAPIKVCFDLARNASQNSSIIKRTDVTGVTDGLLEEGNTVTRATVTWQRLTNKVIFMEEPYSFVEKMVRGPFRSFIQIHQFIEEEEGTVMLDHVQYKSRFGPIGAAIDKMFLEQLMKSYIVSRAKELKNLAEKIT